MTPKPFRSDNVYAGIPYRVLKDASVEAMMPNGEVVNFKTVEQFLASANNALAGVGAARSTVPSEFSGQSNQYLPASTKPLDYYSLLLETIKNTENNSSQLRQLVYERMRFNFKRDLLFGHSTLGLADIVRHVNDFELAVARIEANADDEPPKQKDPIEYEPTPAPVSYEPAPAPVSGELEVYTPPRPIPPVYATAHVFGGGYVRPAYGFSAYKLIGFSVVGIFIVGLIVAATTMWSSRKPPVQLEAAHQPAIADAPAKAKTEAPAKEANSAKVVPPYPVPTSFGIYALGNNKLTELHALPIGIPDPRVALSAEIKQPSTTEISDNNPAFILFRRELINNAPQMLALRVVARVVRETKFVSAKAMVTAIDGTWRIRNVSRELKVSPVPGQPEMVIARTADNTPLPAGRYALVLNRLGYDFTISGPEKSLDFCLEGFETSNGTVFNSCRAP
jgi:hypothetical protein